MCSKSVAFSGHDCSSSKKQHGKDFPGFRFHPTEEELLGFYLKRKSQGKLLHFGYIPLIDLYSYDPWCLPCGEGKSVKHLYFFVEKKIVSSLSKGGRTNRVTASGYWKATGSERSIWDDSTTLIGHKKTLVFYKGRAPKGIKTDWIMNEYRLPHSQSDVVLCRIHRKATPQKWLEKRAQLLQRDHVANNHHSNCNSNSSKSRSYTDKFEDKSTPTLDLESKKENRNCSSSYEEVMAIANTTNNANDSAVYNGSLFCGAGLSSVEALLQSESVKPPLEIPIRDVDWRELKLDACASHVNSKNLTWEDLWSPSSFLCTPKDYAPITLDFPKF